MLKNRLLSALFAIALAVPGWTGTVDSDVDASGPKFTYKTIVLPLQGQLGTTDITAKVKWSNVEVWKILNIKAVCRARSGSAGDIKFDVLDDAVSMLTAQIACDAAGTMYSGTLTATPLSVAAGSAITVTYNATGTPTADDCTIEIVYRSAVAAE